MLPTGLQADPYLKQVVSRTLEVGLRAKPADGVQVSGGLFRTINRDDVVFARAGATQAGYSDAPPGPESTGDWHRA